MTPFVILGIEIVWIFLCMIYCNYDDYGARKLKIISMVHANNVMDNIEIQRCYYVY